MPDILISCDDPELLAWPWEALHDPALGFFGHRARIQRRLSKDMPDPPKLPALPQDRIRNQICIASKPLYNAASRNFWSAVKRTNMTMLVIFGSAGIVSAGVRQGSRFQAPFRTPVSCPAIPR